MAGRVLDSAKKRKVDEFYTRLTDIEKEAIKYKDHFKGKTVLCNCDDPRISRFFYFFYCCVKIAIGERGRSKKIA
jgi:hypothetical protein